jgi:tetratricopeptide (TPR) repeat protein
LFQQAAALYDGMEYKIVLNVLTLISLARAEQQLGDTSSAKVDVEKALALAASFVEKDGPSYLVGLSLLTRGDIERAQGAADAARASFRAAFEHLNKTLGPDHPATKDAKSKSVS